MMEQSQIKSFFEEINGNFPDLFAVSVSKNIYNIKCHNSTVIIDINKSNFRYLIIKICMEYIPDKNFAIKHIIDYDLLSPDTLAIMDEETKRKIINEICKTYPNEYTEDLEIMEHLVSGQNINYFYENLDILGIKIFDFVAEGLLNFNEALDILRSKKATFSIGNILSLIIHIEENYFHLLLNPISNIINKILSFRISNPSKDIIESIEKIFTLLVTKKRNEDIFNGMRRIINMENEKNIILWEGVSLTKIIFSQKSNICEMMESLDFLHRHISQLSQCDYLTTNFKASSMEMNFIIELDIYTLNKFVENGFDIIRFLENYRKFCGGILDSISPKNRIIKHLHLFETISNFCENKFEIQSNIFLKIIIEVYNCYVEIIKGEFGYPPIPPMSFRCFEMLPIDIISNNFIRDDVLTQIYGDIFDTDFNLPIKKQIFNLMVSKFVRGEYPRFVSINNFTRAYRWFTPETIFMLKSYLRHEDWFRCTEFMENRIITTEYMRNWNWSLVVFLNPSLPLEILEKVEYLLPDFAWGEFGISNNINLNAAFVNKYINKNWSFGPFGLCSNKNKITESEKINIQKKKKEIDNMICIPTAEDLTIIFSQYNKLIDPREIYNFLVIGNISPLSNNDYRFIDCHFNKTINTDIFTYIKICDMPNVNYSSVEEFISSMLIKLRCKSKGYFGILFDGMLSNLNSEYFNADITAKNIIFGEM